MMIIMVMGGGDTNNRKDLQETEWESVEWIHLFQDSNQWWTFINMILSS
jgi:menaquinone-dependent protoporphyrinogen IX oxidase